MPALSDYLNAYDSVLNIISNKGYKIWCMDKEKDNLCVCY